MSNVFSDDLPRSRARQIRIQDAGDYFTGTTVETALQELGATAGESTTVSDTTTINLTLTGSDITADGLYTAGDYITLTGADFDVDNMLNTIQGDDNTATSGLAISIDGAGIVTTDVIGDVLTVTGTEVDGSTSNEINTVQGDDNTATSGLAISIDGTGIVTTDVIGDVLTITGTEAQGLSDITTIDATTTDDVTVGDFVMSDGNPWAGWADTDTDTGYIIHWESGDTYPFALFPVTWSGSTPTLSGSHYPIWYVDSNDNFVLPDIARTMTVNGNLTVNGTTTIPTVSGNTNFDSNTLYVDADNNRVGIGTTSPVDPFTVSVSSANSVAHIHNLRDNASNEVLELSGNCRTTPANGDNSYFTFQLTDSSGDEHQEFARMIWRADDVTDGSENGAWDIKTMHNGVLAEILQMSCSGIIFNDDSVDMNILMEGNNDTQLFWLDGGLDTITIGSNTSLGKFGIDGDQDEIQLLVQGNATQNTSLIVAENSAGADQFTLSNVGAGVFTGALSASNLSGTNTGDATHALDLVTTAPITGAQDNIFFGGDGDVTIAMAQATTSADGYVVQADWDSWTDHAADTSQAHSDYLLNSGADEMAGALTCDGIVMDDNHTVGWGGDESITFDGTDFQFTDSLDLGTNIWTDTLAGYVDQDVQSGTTPTFTATNITGVPAASILAGTFGTGAYVMDTSLAVPIVDTPLIQDAATIHIRPSGDADDYVTVKTAADISYIGRDDDDDLIKLEANTLTIAGAISATNLSGTNTGDDIGFVTNDASDTMTGELTLDPGVLFMKEQAEASADVEAFGQIWVNTAEPNELWWTDDAGTDTQLGAAGGGATTELDNLGTVAINTDIASDAEDTDSLGATDAEWLNAYIGDAGKLYFGLGQDASIEHSAANEMTLIATSGVTVESVKMDGGVITGATLAAASNVIEADTVLTITTLAPDTATTQATQGNITSLGTLTSLAVTGAITSGTATSAAGDITLYDAGVLTLNDDGGGNSATLNCNAGEDVALLTGGLDVTGVITSTSPVFTTPALGTPSAAVLTNATGLPYTAIAAGTDGELITWDSDGNIANIAAGTATHVLTSNGPGAEATFQAAAGGAAETLAQTLAAGADANDVNITGCADIKLDSITPDATTITINDVGSSQHVVLINNTQNRENLQLVRSVAGVNSGTPVLEIIAQAAETAVAVVTMLADHASTTQHVLRLTQDGASAGMQTIVTGGTSTAHWNLNPISSVGGSPVEGDLYGDVDGILYYRSNTAYTACNTASDFAEIMQMEGNKSNYKIGDVLVMGTENIEKLDYVSSEIDYEVTEEPIIDWKTGKQKKDKDGKNITTTKRVDKGFKTRTLDTWFNDGAKKVKQSSIPYDTTTVGVWCEKASKLDPNMPVNDKLIVVSLIGLVKVNVCDEGGDITAGDLLVTSSKKGHAMKGVIDSFDKIGSVIGKAREDISFGSKKTALIEMVIGIE